MVPAFAKNDNLNFKIIKAAAQALIDSLRSKKELAFRHHNARPRQMAGEPASNL
jgi:hypothetical protein